MSPLVDLPIGMRTWIWENIQDVVLALRYLMTDDEMLGALATLGKLTEATKAIEAQEGGDDW